MSLYELQYLHQLPLPVDVPQDYQKTYHLRNYQENIPQSLNPKKLITIRTSIRIPSLISKFWTKSILQCRHPNDYHINAFLGF